MYKYTMPWKKAAAIIALGTVSTVLISVLTLFSVAPEIEDVPVD